MRLKLKVIYLLLLLYFSLAPSAQGAVLLQRVHLKAVGDIMVHDVQYRSAYNWQDNTYDFMPMFEPVQEELKADILVGNLETTLSGSELGYSSYPRFNSPDNIAETLKKLGFDLLFTANNHCLDRGELGLKRTLEILDKNNIQHTGTFVNNTERDKPTIITTNGISFGFLNYTYGTNGLNPPKGKEYLVNYLELEKIKVDISNLRPLVDMIVIGLHFGNEYWREPTQEQKNLVHELARAGADIILGTHPHVLQPFEFIVTEHGKTFVVYSLGNFVSGQKQRYRDSGAILNLVIEKSLLDRRPKIVKVDYTPVWVRRYVLQKRLQMEVIPVKANFRLKYPLTDLEYKKLAQVERDVQEIWKPFNNDNKINNLLGIWANNYLSVIDPKSWLTILIKSALN
ncbi:MAG: hypothetical protein PWQ67_1933 [Clostridia bacterium]|jgi:poly-gamma-glutamate synthesis protein (capsule biosynthesis protein)|nr:hypothetical protein [Clostridia bacterium]MDN5323479.1 hypothetical protein [Clostridia bacterium]